MRIDPIVTIAKREYLSRVKTKGFWITTVLLPLAMAALTILPSMIAMKSRASQRLAIVDEVGGYGETLAAKLVEEEKAEGGVAEVLERKGPRKEETAQFKVELMALAGDRAAQRAELDKKVLEGEFDAWLWLSPERLRENEVEYHAESVSNFMTQKRIEEVVSQVVGEARLRQAGIDSAKVTELTQDVGLQTTRVLAEGSRQEGGMAAFFLAYFLFFLLYMIVMLYGQQVMNGVLEEKSSRIVEVILASVRPVELMLGKLLGIGLAGLTQLIIWLTTMALLTAPAAVTALALTADGESLPQVTPMLIVHFLLNFMLGYALFATLYATIGAATNNVQEAQQFVGFLVVFQIAPMFFLFPVINDPDSTRSVVLSMIPLFSPLLMMLRIAVKMPPLWQLLTAYGLTAAFVIFQVWVCARIYRIGILMYGKKPTFKELWRWVRYA
ncbi:MAG: ABC transporter permease [Thermoanaerobaculia bacterium]